MKLSIITINYNNFIGLKKTIESIQNQEMKDFEYIIIDGNSNDKSVELIRDVAGVMKNCKWISETDSGIYNAMNKGIKMSTGDYLLFINSGDILADKNVIKNILKSIDYNLDLISGKLEIIDENGYSITLNPPIKIDLNYCINHGLTHPNTLIKRSLFFKYGFYNENNLIISDWEFFLLVCGLKKCSYGSIPVLISKFFKDGISSRNDKLIQIETENALNRLLPFHLNIKRKLRKTWKCLS